MRFRIKPWLSLPLIALAVALFAYLMRKHEPRVIHNDADLLALLPHPELTTFFLNVNVLRQAGLLSLLQASRPDLEGDYQQFIRQTGFDYTRDLDVLTARGDQHQIFVIARGKFDWPHLREYALQHGGSCNTRYCQAPAAQPGRWAAYLAIQSDVLGLAVSADPANVLLLSPRPIDHPPPISTAPVWLNVAHPILADPKDLPLPLRLFALAVQSADSVTLSAGPGANANRDGGLELRLQARCQNAAVADTTRNQLELDTRLLKMELQREHQHPSPDDLTGLLTSGIFYQSGNTVLGSWPLRRQLLKRLQ